MTHTGVLATILSGLEPAVAIVLACIPLMRPLFGLSKKSDHPSYQFGSSKRTSRFSRKGCDTHGLDPTATFSELVDDNDTSSEIQLQPIKSEQLVSVSSFDKGHRQQASRSPNQAITIERKWEVTRE